MSECKEKLFTEFRTPTRQEWLDKIQVDLKGADFNKRLVWRTNEGFSVQPFYLREDMDSLRTPEALPGEFPYVRGNRKSSNGWYVRQGIEADDAGAANAKALDILNRGVDSLCFHIHPGNVNAAFIGTLLSGIHCDCVELNFSTCGRHCLELARILADHFASTGCDKGSIVGSIEWDPLSRLVMEGKDTTGILPVARDLVEALGDYPNFRCVTVGASALADAGAYIVQELGYALAWGNEYLNLLVEAGVDPDLAASKVKFNLGIGETFFMEMAKFRAARLLWAQIVRQYSPKDESSCMMCAHAVTTEYNMTLFDSYVNLLRTQTEAMSAALAGVHSIEVRPFDCIYETPNDFSERIARNQQLLLKEESHFDKVVDPGAGSYFIEELTTMLATHAWGIFLDVEEEGGFLAAAKDGKIQATVNDTNRARHDAVAKRREFLLGTNQFPNFTEKSGGKVPVQGPCRLGCGHEAEYPAIRSSRLAADFEELRLRVENSGKVPVAFMLTIGNLAMRQARAQFSCNFLACAGYRVVDNLGFKTVEEGVDAALEAGADIVVVCSSDDEYAEYALPAFNYLAGRAMFIVAGAPACMEDLKAGGIENFIHVRCNVLETLREYNEKLGI